MRVSTTNTVTCPRCHVPVEGDYKYCPECAYRLRPDPAEETAPPQPRGGLLLILAGAALLAAGVFVGLRIHKPAPVVTVVSPPRPHLQLDGLQDQLVPIPLGVAEYRLKTVYAAPDDEEAPDQFLRTWSNAGPSPLREALFQPGLLDNPLPLTNYTRILSLVYAHSEDLVEELERHVPVETDKFHMMRNEASRGQWREFVEAVEREPALVSTVPFVRVLWRPKTEAQLEYARGYWEHWWLEVVRRHKARNDALPDGAPRAPLPKRPSWLHPSRTQLADRHGVLLLIPPDWVRIDENGNVSWSIEENTEDLPVTGISWWDVKIFIVWAEKSLGIPNLALPNRGEWMRAFHGGGARRPPDDFDSQGEIGRRWPWGNEVDHDGCNNISWGSEDEPPRPHSVRRKYGIHQGKTTEGVLNMAGNAAEWTDNYEARYRSSNAEGKLYATTWDKDEEGNPFALAPVCGGSYLSGLDECMADSVVSRDKRARMIDVGFRLILKKPGFGQ